MKNTNFEFLTSDESIKSSKTYQDISDILGKMIRNGSFRLGTGYCISMSDMIRTALMHRGVYSKLVECQTTLTDFSVDPPNVDFVGYPDIAKPGEIDTHVVVVTSTNPPLLIDASIQHRLPTNTYAVIETVSLNREDHMMLINQHYANHKFSVSYTQKTKQSVPLVHQESIVDRIETDQKIKKDIQLLKVLNYIGIMISMFALVNVILKAIGYW